jgi:hypothetical protein
MTAPVHGGPDRPASAPARLPRRVPRSVLLYICVGNPGLQCILGVAAFTSLMVLISFTQDPWDSDPAKFHLAVMLLLGLCVRWSLVSWHRIELLRTGNVTTAKILREENLGGGKRVLTYEFTNAAGERRLFVHTSNYPQLVMDDAEEPIVYDPGGVLGVQLVDDLPGSPRIGPDGKIAAKSLAALAVVLLLPTLLVALHLAMLVRLVRG